MTRRRFPEFFILLLRFSTLPPRKALYTDSLLIPSASWRVGVFSSGERVPVLASAEGAVQALVSGRAPHQVVRAFHSPVRIAKGRTSRARARGESFELRAGPCETLTSTHDTQARRALTKTPPCRLHHSDDSRTPTSAEEPCISISDGNYREHYEPCQSVCLSAPRTRGFLKSDQNASPLLSSNRHQRRSSRCTNKSIHKITDTGTATLGPVTHDSTPTPAGPP